ncbi:uncharacterized protein VTP21DRAFT_8813 [Calcarisporiella thermophila]|uniref:uncharacterized protein n=1 Tax=Calcarisporiella thermophila TaxID=911321 RepID=UPI0037426124
MSLPFLLQPADFAQSPPKLDQAPAGSTPMINAQILDSSSPAFCASDLGEFSPVARSRPEDSLFGPPLQVSETGEDMGAEQEWSVPQWSMIRSESKDIASASDQAVWGWVAESDDAGSVAPPSSLLKSAMRSLLTTNTVKHVDENRLDLDFTAATTPMAEASAASALDELLSLFDPFDQSNIVMAGEDVLPECPTGPEDMSMYPSPSALTMAAPSPIPYAMAPENSWEKSLLPLIEGISISPPEASHQGAHEALSPSSSSSPPNRFHSPEVISISSALALIAPLASLIASAARPFPGPSAAARKRARTPRNRKYICDLCGKVCSRPSELAVHRNKHTGERPYKCPRVDCKKAFTAPGNLSRHVRAHAKKERLDPEEGLEAGKLLAKRRRRN